ncbi:hypothetical protein N9D31_03140 [Oligoflexaceae bacterium]|nr:hypothetical protein [Oligoflexaceae bacterium]
MSLVAAWTILFSLVFSLRKKRMMASQWVIQIGHPSASQNDNTNALIALGIRQATASGTDISQACQRLSSSGLKCRQSQIASFQLIITSFLRVLFLKIAVLVILAESVDLSRFSIPNILLSLFFWHFFSIFIYWKVFERWQHIDSQLDRWPQLLLHYCNFSKRSSIPTAWKKIDTLEASTGRDLTENRLKLLTYQLGQYQSRQFRNSKQISDLLPAIELAVCIPVIVFCAFAFLNFSHSH